MNKENQRELLKKIRWIAFTVAATIVLSCIPVAAWFYFERRVGALAEIDSPISLYINSGAREIQPEDDGDIKQILLEEQKILYLNLNDIDVKAKDSYGNQMDHKDFVFCVRGVLSSYYLQLAHTTNNQFEYEIYKTCENDPEDPDIKTVVYYGAVTNNPYTYYFKTTDKIEFEAKNKDETITSEDIAKIDDSYYKMTYGDYSEVDKYAVPIYWISTESIKGSESGASFANYYILRVKWKTATKENDRETDILYISAGNNANNLANGESEQGGD